MHVYYGDHGDYAVGDVFKLEAATMSAALAEAEEVLINPEDGRVNGPPRRGRSGPA